MNSRSTTEAEKNTDFNPPPQDDTIIAVATPAGRGAIGIIRISGRNSLALLEAMTSASIESFKNNPRKSILTRFMNRSGSVIDEGLAVFFPGPNSYTGEDTAELSFHGNPLILQEFLLEAVLLPGLRPAEPGEFTRRAYLNHKMDLTQAEAVSRIIEARSEFELKAGRKNLSGELGRLLSRFRSAMISLKAETEAEVDFSTEDLTFEKRESRIKKIHELSAEIDHILKSSKIASRIAGGFRIAIAGKPNAGKSSLMNAMLGWDRAIVSHIAGTTRDTVTEDMEIDGVGVKFVDTAGLRETEDEIEKEGVRRSRKEIEQSNILLHVIDSSDCRNLNQEIEEFEKVKMANILRIFNKADLGINKKRSHDHDDGVSEIFISCKTGNGLDKLRTEIKNIIFSDPASVNPILLEERQKYHFERIREALLRVVELWKINAPDEITALEIDSALGHIGEITGAVSNEEVLGRIFSMFCVGK